MLHTDPDAMRLMILGLIAGSAQSPMTPQTCWQRMDAADAAVSLAGPEILDDLGVSMQPLRARRLATEALSLACQACGACPRSHVMRRRQQ